MKKIILLFLSICGALIIISGCTSSKKIKISFVDACYNENPGSSGIPMSQIDMLYSGVKNHDDPIARKVLLENCPKAFAEYFN